MPDQGLCQWYWGTHGCTRSDDEHHTLHQCRTRGGSELCSQYDSEHNTARYWTDDGWTEWMPHEHAWHGEAGQ